MTVVARIREYLTLGGLFNPELADHDAVRDLVIDAQATIAAQGAEIERLKAQHQRDMEAVEWCTAGARQIIAERDAAREALRAHVTKDRI